MSGDQLGLPPRRQEDARGSRRQVERVADFDSRENLGVYYTLQRFAEEWGLPDLAWWLLPRPEDTPFRKAGRIYVPPADKMGVPGTESLTLTAPLDGALLINGISFDAAEPVARRWIDVVFQQILKNNKPVTNKITSYQTGKTLNVCDYMLHNRIPLMDGESARWLLSNSYRYSSGIVDFEVRGWVVRGEKKPKRR